MASPAKMPPDKWQQVRLRWETDERDGFQWVVDDMQLPVSAPAVRKKAKTEGWKKRPVKLTKRAAAKAMEAAQKPARGPLPKAAKPSEAEKPLDEDGETNESTEDGKDLTQFGSLGLPGKQEVYVREYCVDFNPTKAAIRAGYSEQSASTIASNLMRNPRVQSAIAAFMRDRVQKMGRDADELVKFHLSIIEFDPNELGEHRIHACRYCWGENHAYQHSPSTWEIEHVKFKKSQKKMTAEQIEAAGEFPKEPPGGWYQAKRGPNEDCPECHGVGKPVVKWKDTRHLSPMAKLLYSGVKESKDGFEVVMLQKQASLSTLSSHLGLNKVAEVQVNTAVVTDTAYVYEDIMAGARERQRKVLIERGIIPADG